MLGDLKSPRDKIQLFTAKEDGYCKLLARGPLIQ